MITAQLSGVLQVMVSVCFSLLSALVLVSCRPFSADSLFFLKGSSFRTELHTMFFMVCMITSINMLMYILSFKAGLPSQETCLCMYV